MAELKATLEALHRCETESDELSRLAASLPAEIEAREVRARAAREAVEAEHKRLEDADHRRRQEEAELQDCEARRNKYQSQTALVKTNEEYTALLNEIDSMTRRISELEEAILVAMEEIDEVQAKLGTFEQEQKREEQDRLREAEQLRERLAEVNADIEAHDRQRQELLADLPPNAKAVFERTRKTLGSGTTAIVGRACSACHRDIPYETINRVIAAELHTCAYCKRILVAPDA